MGLKARASEEFVSVLKRLVGLLPQMNDEDKDRVFDFVILDKSPPASKIKQDPDDD